MNLLRLITFRKGAAGLDPDAQAFITAAGITDPVQESAINQLVLDLKNYNLWSKMVAIYPMVGGTASAHSYNLKDTAQYQITWNGTLTHNFDGVKSNGSTGYGATGIIPNSVLSLDNVHISSYASNVVQENTLDMGVSTNGSQDHRLAYSRSYGGTTFWGANQNGWNTATVIPGMLPIIGHQVVSRTGSAGADAKLYLNSNLMQTGSTSSSALSDKEIYICAYNFGGSLNGVSTSTFSFFSVGEGLDSTETTNFYTAVQNFQVALSEATDADALTFISDAQISNRTQMVAVDQLAKDLKTYNLWSKMTAVYPILGGNAFSHKYNLIDTSLYQITWSSENEAAHTVNGVLSVNGNTGINVSTALNNQDVHIAAYSNSYTAQNSVDWGVADGGYNQAMYFGRAWPSYSNGVISRFVANSTDIPGAIISPLAGLSMNSRSSASDYDIYHNGTLAQNIATAGTTLANYNLYLMGLNNGGSVGLPSSNRFCFFSVGTAMDSTEASDLYTAVQDYQTTLGRQV